MPKVRKSVRAEQDLIEIWVYSYELWGEVQAERYFEELDRVIGLLRKSPQLGKPCDAIREGYRALQAGRHVLYYTTGRGGVTIVRVLHESMNPDIHL